MIAVGVLVVVAAVPDAIAHPLVHEAAQLHRIFKLLDRNDDRVLSAVEAVTGLGVGLEDQSHSQLCAQASTLVSSWPAPCGSAFSLLTDYEIDVVDFADCVKSWGAEALLASDACGSGGAAPTLSFETSLSIFAGGLASTIVEAPPATQPPRPHVDAASPSAPPPYVRVPAAKSPSCIMARRLPGELHLTSSQRAALRREVFVAKALVD